MGVQAAEGDEFDAFLLQICAGLAERGRRGAVRSISVWACRYIILEIIAQNARFTRKFQAYLFIFVVFPATFFFAGFAAVAVFFAADVVAAAATREAALTTGNFGSSAAAPP